MALSELLMADDRTDNDPERAVVVSSGSVHPVGSMYAQLVVPHRSAPLRRLGNQPRLAMPESVDRLSATNEPGTATERRTR